MRMKFLLIPLLIVSAPQAFAGCANYVDGSLSASPPPYLICYDDSCETTVLEYECANVSSSQTGFASGWATSCQVIEGGKPECSISWQGREIDPAKHGRIRIEPLPETTSTQ